jgi:hypothetical protein
MRAALIDTQSPHSLHIPPTLAPHSTSIFSCKSKQKRGEENMYLLMIGILLAISVLFFISYNEVASPRQPLRHPAVSGKPNAPTGTTSISTNRIIAALVSNREPTAVRHPEICSRSPFLFGTPSRCLCPDVIKRSAPVKRP